MKQNADICTPRRRGSALVLVLLMIVLLTTIAVSFLSTARVEQIATGNFTRQTAARGLADLATAEAMAKIAEGFTATNPNATTVTISQPGLIRSFEFTGNGNPTVRTNELFPTTDLVAGTNFNINTNGIITGNPAEPLEVPWQNIVDANGQAIGRITYYVDDEGTKLNLNRAVANRDTLNASARRPLDIAALAGADTNIFNAIMAGTNSSPTNITSWVHFFRPEQAVGAGVVAANQTPFVSAAVSTNTNSPNIKTAWGTDRLYINDANELPVTNASVTNIYEALTGLNPANGNPATNALGRTGQGLDTIFQGNFADKYTSLGLKQTAANILQMRTPGATNIEFWFTNTIPLLGSDNLDSNGIPREFLGYAPYPMISEVGFSYKFTYDSSGFVIYLNIQPTIELYNPYPFDFYFPANAYPRLVVKLRKFTNEIIYSITNGPTQTLPIETGRIPASLFRSQNVIFEANWNPQVRETFLFADRLHEFCPTNANGAYIPAGSRIQTHLLHVNWGMRVNLPVDTNAFTNTTNMFTVTGLTNATLEVEYVRLLSGLSTNAYNSGNVLSGFTNTIRDWVVGDQIGPLLTDLQTNPVSLPAVIGTVGIGPDSPAYITPQVSSLPAPVPTVSAQRLSFHTMVPALAATNATNWQVGPSTWVTNVSSYYGQQGLDTNAWATPNADSSRPLEVSQVSLPSDPSFSNNVATAVFAGTNTNDMRAPILQTGSFTSPSDLGLVPTSVPYRRLRMQVQPTAESAAGLIPDWAMLEVISFGSQAVGANILDQFQPVNLNGVFHVPQGATPPAARDIGLKSLAQVLDNAPDKLADPMSTNGSTVTITEPRRFLGTTQTGQNDAATVVSNIGGMTWSASSAWTNRRAALGFPTNAYLLPSEIMEIAGVADSVLATDYNNTSSHFKWNEGRASALLPAVSTKSSQFMIYACAQTLDKQGQVQSEALTKTLVEVEQDPTAPTTYKVKKLYTEPVRMD